ncbi:MAG: SlyX family protein [Spirochaetaceae bacterium]|nr:SlyX family protein [Spirochaetaceae bacterium]MBO5235717.1 SlyX family protein [Spirochaetaceae bacterium]
MDITEKRLTDLEVRISYLEDFVSKLQNVVVEQENTIDRLQTENRLIKGKIQEMSEQLEGDIPNRKPPHY